MRTMTIDEAKAKLVAWCNSQVGYREGANNYNKYAERLDKIDNLTWGPKQNQPWCGEFVLCAFVECFGVDLALELQCSSRPTSIPLCSAGAGNFKQAGRWNVNPQVGDVVFFVVNGAINHTGIVTSVGMGAITTVEGNSGDMVSRNTVPLNSPRIAGYGRPRWEVVMTQEETDGGQLPEDPQPTPEPDPAETCTTELPILRAGDESEAVRNAQRMLIARGFRCGGSWSWVYQRELPDGEFGPKTQEAVRSFQDGEGIPASGKIDSATWAALICN